MKILLSFFFFTSVIQLAAQKEDHVWLLGGSGSISQDSIFKSCALVFGQDSVKVQFLNRQLPIERTNASLCDSSGQLMCYSNGENLYNRNFQIVQNGGDFYPNGGWESGYPGMQGFMLLRHPGKSNEVVHIYGDIFLTENDSAWNVGYNLRYAIADMNANNGLGKVTQRNLEVSQDTCMFTNMTAVRHGNGRDWWIIMPHFREHAFLSSCWTPTVFPCTTGSKYPLLIMGLGRFVFLLMETGLDGSVITALRPIPPLPLSTCTASTAVQAC